ncbi:MAG: polysaccharide biosynthesis/export family protein [Sedimentisphaerales bacterium]|nr:polysaccharide biosynthesis/export family protein [Sedimentisphaerales bacterium]
MDGMRKASEGKSRRPGCLREKSCSGVVMTTKTGCLLFAASLLLFLSILSGCGNKFFDPTQVGRFRPVPAVNVILDSLGVAEETPVAWEQAQGPKPVDTVAQESDYMFRAGDIVSVAIFELLQEGIQFVNNYVVTETGKISIPEVGVIEAAGMTEAQLEQEIKRILSPDILKNPSVIVTLSGSQQRAFSILGDGVPLPGRYPIPRYNFRLTDALATAGGPRQFNVSYVFVSRFNESNKETGVKPRRSGLDELELEVIEPENTIPPRRIPQVDSTSAHYRDRSSRSNVVVTSSEMATDNDLQATTMPDSFVQPDSGSSNQITSQNRWQPSSQEPVGVNDILNTLEQRAIRERIWLNGQVNIDNAIASFRELSRPDSMVNMQANSRTSMAYNRSPVVPEASDEPVSVRDILKTLQERSRKQKKWLDGSVNVDNARESLQEISRSDTLADQRIRKPRAMASSAQVAQRAIDKRLESKEPGNIEWKFENGKWVPVQTDTQTTAAPTQTPTPTQENEEPGHVEWKFINGKWVPIQIGSPTITTPAEPVRPVIKIEQKETPIEQYVRPASDETTRLIRIPAKDLLAGDPRYNIIIKPGDTIHVPVDVVGEFCIMGHVNRPGYITLTGRSMTLKMAIAAAGGLGPLAWPKRVEVVRRIGNGNEEFVMVDLDKIAGGEQPDFFIKPNDFINVGTHPTSRWRAILRNAFRATYGFGFVYDRNFADRDFGTHRPLPGFF